MHSLSVQVIGPTGSGKTTVMEVIYEALEKAGYATVVEDLDLQEMVRRNDPEMRQRRHEVVRDRVTIHLKTTPTNRSGI